MTQGVPNLLLGRIIRGNGHCRGGQLFPSSIVMGYNRQMQVVLATASQSASGGGGGGTRRQVVKYLVSAIDCDRRAVSGWTSKRFPRTWRLPRC